MLNFRYRYFITALLLFFIELFIALYVHDEIIRPHIGDFLVVILVYCSVRSFVNLPVYTTAIFALLFSYTVEVLQYFKIVEKLGLQHFKIARIIIGTSFSWIDILAYTLGILFVLLFERIFNNEIRI